MRLAFQNPADFIAIHIGHFHIQQDQIRVVLLASRQRFPAAGRHIDLTILGKNGVERVNIDRLVIDDQ